MFSVVLALGPVAAMLWAVLSALSGARVSLVAAVDGWSWDELGPWLDSVQLSAAPLCGRQSAHSP